MGTPKMYMILKNLITVSCMIFAIDITSIHLVNVSITMNKNLKPPGVTDPPPLEKVGVCLPRSYRAILNEARIHKHNM
jgi:hypothetical protein